VKNLIFIYWRSYLFMILWAVVEGDKLMKEVLNGGYNVHPVPPPNSEIKEKITKR